MIFIYLWASMEFLGLILVVTLSLLPQGDLNLNGVNFFALLVPLAIVWFGINLLLGHYAPSGIRGIRSIRKFYIIGMSIPLSILVAPLAITVAYLILGLTLVSINSILYLAMLLTLSMLLVRTIAAFAKDKFTTIPPPGSHSGSSSGSPSGSG